MWMNLTNGDVSLYRASANLEENSEGRISSRPHWRVYTSGTECSGSPAKRMMETGMSEA